MNSVLYYSTYIYAGIRVPVAKDAAKLMMQKLKKYDNHLNSPVAKLALSLDRSLPNKSEDVVSMKAIIKDMLARDYSAVDYPDPPSSVDANSTRSKLALLLTAARLPAQSLSSRRRDEIDDFFEFTSRSDFTVMTLSNGGVLLGIRNDFPRSVSC